MIYKYIVWCCKKCLTLFVDRPTLLKHTCKNDNDINAKKYYICNHNDCYKCFQQSHELNRHKRLVHNKKIKCVHCKQKFSTKWHLNRHISNIHWDIYSSFKLKHKMVTQYKCITCNLFFKKSTELKEHNDKYHP